MTFDTSSTFTDTSQMLLEIAPDDITRAWQQTVRFSTVNSRWNAYLNQLSLNILLPWLREEYVPEANVFPNNASLPSFWEITNGTGIDCEAGRLVIIPSEAIDISEMRVPQEWVDIPTWAAEYYIAVQVEPEAGWLRIWGYTTHAQLKAKANYDASDRTYSISQEEVFDINVLWMARQLCPDEVIRAEIPLLTALPATQAENLLQRLGNPEIFTPRLAIPFGIWGALLENSNYRQQLYQLRQGMPTQFSVLDWMQRGVSDLAASIGWGKIEIQPISLGARSSELAETTTALVRELTIDGGKYELRVLPKANSSAYIWRIELRNAVSGGLIPAGFKLRLLTEDLQAFENNEDMAMSSVEHLYIEVALSQGEGLVWEIEPTPVESHGEILMF
ncbi:DUF1822 family protein [Calothrix sp. UHCC 0171]|uniref:DUF1822 family protein n=1 Tax=Calothrix sp. UHCC 0171 TaxID=3110245 RepID=UPI002B20DA8F|nr:DUF1822 family protein [Calothrix sp. UHCC 0171]MEA5572785.1 DUF1822 family protein [Calothrix sp. UHCC 0171]